MGDTVHAAQGSQGSGGHDDRGGTGAASSAGERAVTCRMFENDLFEYFSHIHPATPFVFWLPVVGWFVYRGHVRMGIGLAPTAGLFVGGVLLWTLAEYTLHRYVFHWVSGTPWGKRMHFILHGVHHDFPNDKTRLVMPLGFSVPVSLLTFALFSVALGRYTSPFFAGFVLGYLCYDGTHYMLHHFKLSSRWGKWLKRHHMLHHHMDHDGGFGVSSPFWDMAFGTMPVVRAKRTTVR